MSRISNSPALRRPSGTGPQGQNPSVPVATDRTTSRKFKWTIGTAPGQYVKTTGPSALVAATKAAVAPSVTKENAKQGTVAGAVAHFKKLEATKDSPAPKPDETQAPKPVVPSRLTRRPPIRRQTAPISYKPGAPGGSNLRAAIDASASNPPPSAAPQKVASPKVSHHVTAAPKSPFNVKLRPVGPRKASDAVATPPGSPSTSSPSLKLDLAKNSAAAATNTAEPSPPAPAPQKLSPRSDTVPNPAAETAAKPKVQSADTNSISTPATRETVSARRSKRYSAPSALRPQVPVVLSGSIPKGDTPVEVVAQSNGTVRAGDLIAKFYEDPDPDHDLLSLYEMNDYEPIKEYFVSKEHIREVIDCFVVPRPATKSQPDPEGDKLQFVASIGFYIFTAGNTSLVDKLVEHSDLIDYFFLPISNQRLYDRNPATEWFGAMQYLLCRYMNGESIIPYAQSKHGFSWLRTLFDSLEDPRVFDTVKAMVGNDASLVRWNEVFTPPYVNFGDLLIYCFQQVKPINENAFSYADDKKLFHMVEVVGHLVRQAPNSPMARPLFAAPFLRGITDLAIASGSQGRPTAIAFFAIQVLHVVLDACSSANNPCEQADDAVKELTQLSTLQRLQRSLAARPVSGGSVLFTTSLLRSIASLIKALASTRDLSAIARFIESKLLNTIVALSFDHPAASALHNFVEDIFGAAIDVFSVRAPIELATHTLVAGVLDRILSALSTALDSGKFAQNLRSAERTLLPHLVEILRHLNSASVANPSLAHKVPGFSAVQDLHTRIVAQQEKLTWPEIPGQPSIAELKRQKLSNPPTNVKSLKVD